jgi:hypothetical protein
MVTKGLIVTEERKMEEIRVELSSKPVSFSQESAGVGLRIFTCHLYIGRLRVNIKPLIGPFRQPAGRRGELRGGKDADYFHLSGIFRASQRVHLTDTDSIRNYEDYEPDK